ncbi:MAG TPA: LemA family protein [Bryobacteraceae bacterium]|jgi:LemA protein|nr:LemA family protein [Bryobacteraceae bacterium]
MRAALIISGVLLLFGLVAVSGKLIAAHQQLSVESSDIQARWNQLDRDMKEQAKLVPGFVARHANTPEAAAAQEARTALLAASNKQDEIRADIRLTAAIDRALEKNLVSDQNLQDELADVEENLGNDRENYNDAIKKYNTDLQLFPRNVIAALFHFRRDDAYYPTPPN